MHTASGSLWPDLVPLRRYPAAIARGPNKPSDLREIQISVARNSEEPFSDCRVEACILLADPFEDFATNILKMNVHDSAAKSPHDFAVVPAGGGCMPCVEQKPDGVLGGLAKSGNFLGCARPASSGGDGRQERCLAPAIGRQIPRASSHKLRDRLSCKSGALAHGHVQEPLGHLSLFSINEHLTAATFQQSDMVCGRLPFASSERSAKIPNTIPRPTEVRIPKVSTTTPSGSWETYVPTPRLHSRSPPLPLDTLPKESRLQDPQERHWSS